MSDEIGTFFGGDHNHGEDYAHGQHDLGQEDTGHHAIDLHEAHYADAPLFTSAHLASSAHGFDNSLHNEHLVSSAEHFADAHQSYDDHSNMQIGHSYQDVRAWPEINFTSHPVHLHLLRHSDAEDSNRDGVSDAASKYMGLDSHADYPHATLQFNYEDSHGHLHHTSGRDSDGDGFSDDVERLIGTDPNNANSFPSIVEAHHFPVGSDENLPGTIDISPISTNWQMP